jgi:putative ABC transport system permease protein
MRTMRTSPRQTGRGGQTPLAWLNLIHERNRLWVAVAGVAFAVLLMFMNFGFLGALAKTASLVYEQLNAEVFLISPKARSLSYARPFPRSRLYQAAGLAGIERVMPLYLGSIEWRSLGSPTRRATIQTYGFHPRDPVFLLPDLQQSTTLETLQLTDRVLIDRLSRSEYGSQATGREAEAGTQRVRIGGQYTLGSGFAAGGSIMVSDETFLRLFPAQSPDQIQLGLLKLQPDADPIALVQTLQTRLPPDVLVLTKAEIAQRDRAFWFNTTATGFIFNLGVGVALIVGLVIVYQILFSDINEHLPQYATLKAMGYMNRYLFKLVLEEAIVLAVIGFVPGFLISLILYALTRSATSGSIPIEMDGLRALSVFVGTAVGAESDDGESSRYFLGGAFTCNFSKRITRESWVYSRVPALPGSI